LVNLSLELEKVTAENKKLEDQNTLLTDTVTDLEAKE